jgi:hypothetical protein
MKNSRDLSVRQARSNIVKLFTGQDYPLQSSDLSQEYKEVQRKFPGVMKMVKNANSN